MAEQPTCDSCKRGKFDPPKAKCREVDFHWLRAGTKWDFDGDAYKPVVTGTADHEMFDGLLVREDEEKNTGKLKDWEKILLGVDPNMPKTEPRPAPPAFSIADSIKAGQLVEVRLIEDDARAFIEGRSNKTE